MKRGFALMIPILSLSVLILMARVATTNVHPKEDAQAVSVASDMPMDTVVYVSELKMDSLRLEYQYVAKGGLEKAETRGERVLDEMDKYLLRLNREVQRRKAAIAQKEKELNEVPWMASKSKPASKPKKSGVVVQEESTDDY